LIVYEQITKIMCNMGTAKLIKVNKLKIDLCSMTKAYYRPNLNFVQVTDIQSVLQIQTWTNLKVLIGWWSDLLVWITVIAC